MRSKGDRTWHFFHPLNVREYLQSCRVRTDVPGDKSDSRHAPDLMFNAKLGELCSIDGCKLSAHLATLHLR